MLITKQKYDAANELIRSYKRQQNDLICGNSRIISESQFRALLPTKSTTHVGDLVVIPTSDFIWHSADEMTYELVACTGHCGNDEFYGKNTDGTERTWDDRTRSCVIDSIQDLF